MDAPVVEIEYSGELQVRPYRRGTYLGDRHLEEVIEHALGSRYSFGRGWSGEAQITIRLFETRDREAASALGSSGAGDQTGRGRRSADRG